MGRQILIATFRTIVFPPFYQGQGRLRSPPIRPKGRKEIEVHHIITELVIQL